MRVTHLALFCGLGATLLAAGCASHSQDATRSRAESAPVATFERQVAPFVVMRADSMRIAHPFLGGFDVPRPQFVDIDADGDQDLFVQEHTSRLMHFENVGTPDAPTFVWRSDAYAGLDIGEWYRFGDLDADGDLDLLAETPFSYVRLFRNEGSAQSARWTLAADSLALPDGSPLFSDRQNIPNLVDIDADGKMDLFVGRLDGTVSRFEIIDPNAPIPRFELIAERFENIEIVSQFGLPGIQNAQPTGSETGFHAPRHQRAGTMTTMHGANTMTWADADGDGDYDLFWGDYFEPSLLLISNQGTPQSPSLRGEPQPYPPRDPVQSSGYNAPTVADLDGNGHLDLLVGVLGGAFDPQRTSTDNLWFYAQDESGMERTSSRFLDQIDVGSDSAPALGDLDGDGMLDLIVASKSDPEDDKTGKAWWFRGVSDARTEFRAVGALDVGTAFHLSPTLGDLDGDGEDDLAMGTWRGGIRLYLSKAGALVPLDTLDLPSGSHATPALGDLDGDGDLDLIAGTSRGSLVRFENVGTPTAPLFAEGQPVADIDIGRRAHAALGDLDADGALELFVSGFDTVAVYSVSAEVLAPMPSSVLEGIALPPQATFALGDVTRDGVLDAVVGGRSGGVLFLRGRQ